MTTECRWNFCGSICCLSLISQLFLKCGEIIKAASMVVAGAVGVDLKWWIHGTLARWSWCLLGWTRMPVPATFCRPALSPLGLTTMESCSVCLPDIECLPPRWSEQSLRHHQVSAAMFLQMEKVVGVGQPVASPSHMHCNKAHVLRCHPSNDQMPLRVLDTHSSSQLPCPPLLYHHHHYFPVTKTIPPFALRAGKRGSPTTSIPRFSGVPS